MSGLNGLLGVMMAGLAKIAPHVKVARETWEAMDEGAKADLVDSLEDMGVPAKAALKKVKKHAKKARAVQGVLLAKEKRKAPKQEASKPEAAKQDADIIEAEIVE